MLIFSAKIESLVPAWTFITNIFALNAVEIFVSAYVDFGLKKLNNILIIQ